MPRRARIDLPDAIHHVTARTVNRATLFRDVADYVACIQFLGLACERYRLRCLAFCLMPNHLHAVLHAQDGQVSSAMQYLAAAYARRHHHRYRSSGHVFQGRYDSMLVNRDAYLLEVVRYVLLNPVRARLCGTAIEWRWSSAREALGLRAVPEWMDFSIVHGLLGPVDGNGVARLERFLSAGARPLQGNGGVRPQRGQTPH